MTFQNQKHSSLYFNGQLTFTGKRFWEISLRKVLWEKFIVVAYELYIVDILRVDSNKLKKII